MGRRYAGLRPAEQSGTRPDLIAVPREIVGNSLDHRYGVCDVHLVQLRAVTPKDWRLWREVRLAALADAPDAFSSTLAYWSGEGDTEQRWRSRLQDVPLNVVALVDGVPVGQASGTELGADGRVELISMWVSPDARGTGVAQALVEAVAEWAYGVVGASELRLSVRRTNARAIGRYRQSGFVHVEEPGDEHAELTMVRRLQA